MLKPIHMNGRNHQGRWQGESGSALIVSVLLIVLITGGALSAVMTTSLNQNKTQNLLNDKQAFYIAEAGLAHGKMVLNQNIANWSKYATVNPTTLISATSLSGIGSYSVTTQAASGPGLLMTATGTANNSSTSVSSLVIVGYGNQGYAFATGQNLTISGSPAIAGTAGSVIANGNLTISGSPNIAMNAEAAGTYTVTPPGAPVIGGFAGGGQAPALLNSITASTYSSTYDYQLRSNGNVKDSSGAVVFSYSSHNPTWNCWTATPAKAATRREPAVPATWTLTCSTPPNGTFYVQGNAVINSSVGSSASPWIATILADNSIQVTTNAATLYMRPPVQSDGGLYHANTQNLLFIATGDLWIEGTATQTFSSGIAMAYEQVAISGNPTYSGYIVAQDSASASSLVTSDSISGNMQLTYNGNLSNPLQGTVQTQSTLY